MLFIPKAIGSLSLHLQYYLVYHLYLLQYIAKYDVFNKIKKYNDFVSIGLDFILLNVLLVIINLNTLDFGWWYIKIALPIVFVIYLIINILLSVRFIKMNRFVKTGIILFLINVFIYVPPMLINVKNIEVQKEIDQANILNANFSDWQADVHIENNIHLIVALSLLTLSIIFFGVGIMKLKKKKQIKLRSYYNLWSFFIFPGTFCRIFPD